MMLKLSEGIQVVYLTLQILKVRDGRYNGIGNCGVLSKDD